MIPVVICVGGTALDTWTEMTLKRSKNDMTGSLSMSIFAGAMQSTPMLTAIRCGAEITVYIAGHLAFTGTVDKREGSGTRPGGRGADQTNQKTGKGQSGSQASVSIGATEYTIKVSARGKTKRLIDSSHEHPTTNMMQPTTREVCEKLVEPWQIQLDWKGEVIKLDKVRFRDGALVVDELQRIATENCYFMYETREGQLRVTDGVGTESGGSGEPLILGQNILTFSSEQSEDKAKSKVKVKGQRTRRGVRGRGAVSRTHRTVRNRRVRSRSSVTVPHYGDATDKALERRARFEMNKRNSESKKITIDVFHVQSASGKPWDIGDCHYVEVPPEGIFDMFECTDLTYHCNAEKTLKTTLTLSPPPSGGASGAGGGGGGGGFGLSMLNMGIGAARRSQAGVPIVDGQYPDVWGPPELSEMPQMSAVDEAARPLTEEEKAEQEELRKTPPLFLPPWFGEETS